MSEQQAAKSPNWERMIGRSMREVVIELRRARRWKNFFRIAILVYLVLLFIGFKSDPNAEPEGASKTHTALIDIRGPIAAGAMASADHIDASLRAAFKDKKTKAILLRINSPGGSPVQADYVYNEIKRLRNKHKEVKVYAVCTDLCASAAYYIASASNKIYADRESMVGSIGVLMNGFGFVDAMKKVGVSRRLFVAGKNKGFLDPFSPVSPEAKVHVHQMLNTIHKIFIKRVIQGRGKRLHTNNPELFTGLIWTGEKAKQLGLIDGFGSPGDVARRVIKEDNVVNYSYRRNYWERLTQRLGASVGSGFADAFQAKISTPHLS